jgi:hypothetical protein
MNIQELLENNGLKISKRSGATYEWQEHAVRMWNDLKISGKPTKNWFKLFRDAYKNKKQGKLSRVYSIVADVNANKPDYYFYKVFNNI